MDNSTLEISDGVIAGNYAPSGGGVYALNSTVNMVGGIISGNGTNNYESGYGAGICAEDSMVTITNGYITNNKYQFYTDEGHKGNGCHGGGGIAAFSHNEGQKNGSLVISGATSRATTLPRLAAAFMLALGIELFPGLRFLVEQ